MSQETPQIITGPTPLDEQKHQPQLDPHQTQLDSHHLVVQAENEVDPTHHAHQSILQNVHQQQVQIPLEQPRIANTAAIYFCFVDEKFDKPDYPNKLILAVAAPTVADLCSTLKVLFFPGHEVTLTAAFMQGMGTVSSEVPEDSALPVPVNDRSAVVLLKTRYAETSPKLINPHTIQMTHWLQGHNLDTPEVLNAFQQNRVTLDNMKYLKDQDLQAVGIRDWGTRVNILEAINKYFALFPPIMLEGALRQSMLDTQVAPIPDQSNKRKYDGKDVFLPNKKAKTTLTGKRRIRFKDLDVLVNDPLLPVDIKSTVRCDGSNLLGTVVLNKQKKPVIEFMLKGKKRPATIAQFFKAATSESLQAKGDSWSKIHFSDVVTSQSHSLEELKYIIKGPRKAVSAFLYFSKEIRETLPTGADFAKKSGDMWKALSEEAKEPYRQKEAEDKIRFKREKEHWIELTSQLQRQRDVDPSHLLQYEDDNSQTGDEHE